MLETVWTYAAHQAVHTLLVEGDDCFVATKNTRLVAMKTASGEERWSVRIENPWGWVAATPERVFYLNQHSSLIAIDRYNGDILWSRKLRGINGWLHALGQTVIVGGWRGYTDILAINASDGSDRWCRPAGSRQLHSTRIHAESRSLMLADPEDRGTLIFLDLDTGHELARLSAVGRWVTEFCERPTGTSTAEKPLVLESGSNAFFLVDGTTPTVKRIAVLEDIWSKNLVCAGSVVPFITSTGQLVAWSLSQQQMLVLGHIEHNRRDLLPFCQISDQSFAVGTSFGRISVFPQAGAPPISRRVGKRISTQIATSDSVLVLGTESGQVLGVNLQQDG